MVARAVGADGGAAFRRLKRPTKLLVLVRVPDLAERLLEDVPEIDPFRIGSVLAAWRHEAVGRDVRPLPRPLAGSRRGRIGKVVPLELDARRIGAAPGLPQDGCQI